MVPEANRNEYGMPLEYFSSTEGPFLQLQENYFLKPGIQNSSINGISCSIRKKLVGGKVRRR